MADGNSGQVEGRSETSCTSCGQCSVGYPVNTVEMENYGKTMGFNIMRVEGVLLLTLEYDENANEWSILRLKAHFQGENIVEEELEFEKSGWILWYLFVLALGKSATHGKVGVLKEQRGDVEKNETYKLQDILVALIAVGSGHDFAQGGWLIVQ